MKERRREKLDHLEIVIAEEIVGVPERYFAGAPDRRFCLPRPQG